MLTPVWQIDPNDQNPSLSALDPQVLKELCLAESNTLAFLEEKGYCFGCPGKKCHQPHSLVNMVRSFVQNGNSMECDDLFQAYKSIRSNFTNVLVDCVEDIKLNWNPTYKYDRVTKCPTMFMPTVVDVAFSKDNLIIRNTISYFPTVDKDNAKEMFQNIANFDRGDSDLILGAYDTKLKYFMSLYVSKASQSDMVSDIFLH